MKIDITPYHSRDEVALSVLLQAAELSTEDITPEMLEHFLTAHAGHSLAGAVGLEVLGEDGLLRSVAVDEAHRGMGIGKQLVGAMEAHAREVGVRNLYLLTTTAETFFANLGYQLVAREEAPAAVASTSQFAELCPASSRFMRKSLVL